MIKSGGENVASREVEEVIHAHPPWRRPPVFAIPHPRWIEAVAAVVVPRAGGVVAPEEITAFCPSASPASRPPDTSFVADGLPKNPSGKILKRELRTMHAGLAAEGRPP